MKCEEGLHPIRGEPLLVCKSGSGVGLAAVVRLVLLAVATLRARLLMVLVSSSWWCSSSSVPGSGRPGGRTYVDLVSHMTWAKLPGRSGGQQAYVFPVPGRINRDAILGRAFWTIVERINLFGTPAAIFSLTYWRIRICGRLKGGRVSILSCGKKGPAALGSSFVRRTLRSGRTDPSHTQA